MAAIVAGRPTPMPIPKAILSLSLYPPPLPPVPPGGEELVFAVGADVVDALGPTTLKEDQYG